MSLHKDAVKLAPRIPDLPPDFLAWQSVAVLVGAGETRSLVAKPRNMDDCRDVINFCRKTGLSLCPRGSGRSYGDAILNDQNVILDMSRMNRLIAFDEITGTLTVEPGARLADLYHEFHHHGWTLPASPSDSTISVGGALAANVHGNDSWRVGNFGDQVLQLKVITAAGDLRSTDRGNNQELFMAVIGGMGLISLVVEVTLQLRKIPSPFLEVDITSADNVVDLIAKLDRIKDNSDFIVVWVDAYARRKKLGRAVIHATRWSDREADPATAKADVGKSVELLASQKKRAMIFYQASKVFINLGFHLQKIPCPPVTTILRLHRRDDHVISFSEDGYSLNVEFHPKKRHARKMAEFIEKFIECGIKYGSRVHLPKDHTLTRDQFRRLYPRYQEFLDLKALWDPENLFQSDMYCRLFAPD